MSPATPDHRERFEALFAAHYRDVHRFALRRTTPAAAEEIANETFLVCWRRIASVPEGALPWLYATAGKCLANQRRADARHLRRERAAADDERSAPPGRDPAERFADRDAVLYTETTSEIVFKAVRGAPEIPGQRIVVRIWQHGDRLHQFENSVQIDDRGRPVPDSAPGRQRENLAYDQNGDVRRQMSDGKVQTFRADDPDWKDQGRAVFADNLRSVVDEFREHYEKAQLHDVGPTTFAGRPAHAYLATGPNGRRETFYVDPDTAQPLGAVMTTPTYAPKVDPQTHKLLAPSSSGRPTGEMTNTVVIDRVERLPATPANLAKLDAPAIDAAASAR